jgi:molecular chaperone HtpG
MTDPSKQTLGFQAEVRELLQLMIHSLYSNKEIFLRELISNASDACDRLRFAAIAQPQLLSDNAALSIHIDFDTSSGTLTIRDNGIGMSREEAIAHLGTIAKSGTREFFSKLSGDQQKDAQLIGQFGVGFYSAFIVADQVEVLTRKAGSSDQEGTRWQSRADGEFTVEPIERAQNGTEIILHLKSDAREFAEPYRLRALVRRYSDHISLPILMRKEGAASLEYETVNQAKALWARPRSELKSEDYEQFYQHIAHDPGAPLIWSHNKVEGKREYTSLIYIPARAPFDLWQRDKPRGLKLYVRRVFIMDDAEQFLPLYLRFVRGVIDSSDLPLNVSRELLQQDAEVEAIRSGLTKRVLELLTRLAADEPEKYAAFWREFGAVLKEGVSEDPENRDKILPLLRFASTENANNEQTVSLAEYVGRLKTGQDKIYCVVADSVDAARGSPYIEELKKRGIEVLLLGDRVDEWIINQLETYEGKRFKNAARGDLELGSLTGEAEQKQRDEALKEHKPLLKKIKDALGDRINEVRISSRLHESPACLVLAEQELSSAMRRMLATAGRDLPQTKPLMELNVTHPLVQYLENETDQARFAELSQIIYDQAALSEAGQVDNATDYLQRLNRLLVRLASTQSSAS